MRHSASKISSRWSRGRTRDRSQRRSICGRWSAGGHIGLNCGSCPGMRREEIQEHRFCTGLGSFLVSLHQLAFAVDVGFDKLYAAWVLGMGSFLAIAGTIFTGTISDYIGRELSAILAYAISIV